MFKQIGRIGAGLAILLATGLLVLTNMGVIRLGAPYIYGVAAATGDRPVAFVDVNVLPMDEERVLPGQTVLVRDGVIVALGPAGTVPLPAGALLVAGNGSYLLPGLVDMHVHIENENDLLLLVANGVTTARNMWGNSGRKLWFGLPDQLALRQQIAAGHLFGPTIYTAGPIMEGEPAFHPLAEPIRSPAAAVESVRWQAAQGYDFVKVYDHLSAEAYEVVLAEAAAQGLPVAGHVPVAVGLDGVLAGGQQTIEHMSGYIDPDAVKWLIPPDQLADYAERTAAAGVWNVVTLSEYPKSGATPAGFERLQAQSGLDYLSPGTRLLSPFFYMMTRRSHSYRGADYPEQVAALNRQMVAALHDAGAGILLGTDAAQAYHLPGYAVHEELALLVEAGLTPYEAIAAGSRDAALALGAPAAFGTIAPGQRADLLLVDGNPLADVGQLQNRRGVMLRGRWLPAPELDGLLAGLAASYEPSWLDRLWPLALLLVGLVSRRFVAK
ncbi:MAG: amidohydrolase family protein [Ardenticatenales bacterium]|nr:amidohydrolase family protein [Ardenticatenales bacterium]